MRADRIFLLASDAQEPHHLETYHLPGDLEARIGAFIGRCYHLRYHETIANLTPADVHFEHGQSIGLEREWIRRLTIQDRRLMHPGKPT